MVARGALIKAVYAMTPTSFENLVFDLVSAVGLRNPVWRTPGADGGRDIEGDFQIVDFSGFHALQRWYVECKRYDRAVDWPTVYEKVAYAENHDADFLLVVTTASLSPACKTEVNCWNAKRRRLAVRYWDATTLEQVLLKFPMILVTHGLSADPRLTASSFVSLALQSSKVTQAAYGQAEFSGQNNPPLEAASALAELMTVRMRDAEIGVKPSKSGFVAEDAYPWLSCSSPDSLNKFDRYGLRAVLCLFRHVAAAERVTVTFDGALARVAGVGGRALNAAAERFLSEVSIWAGIELRVGNQELILVARASDG